MENFAASLFNNPLLYIEYALSFYAAIGILYFLAGFGGSLPHIFTYSEGAEHMVHARTRILQGLYICMTALGIWEFIKMLLGEMPPVTLVLVIVLLSPIWAPWLKALATGKSGGGH